VVVVVVVVVVGGGREIGLGRGGESELHVFWEGGVLGVSAWW